MTMQEFITGFIGASPLEIIASVAGFICVFLIIRRSMWCWFFGFIQVSLFAYIFFGAKLYSDAGLHVVYMGLQFYGWWNWMQHTNSHNKQMPELLVHPSSSKDLALWSGVAITGTFILGYLMHTYTDASFAYADAFTTCTSLVAQWLLTRRHLFNWVFWIVVNVVAIFIYMQKGLYPTSVLYFTFLIMCFFGQYSWWQQYRRQQASGQNIEHEIVR
ncbi:MAG: nicotinamide mononucleotide transporter [Patiriisocius sp.]|jgi:nicotinamide mononucleotide transporter